jgi:hypothetical protein
MAGGPDETALPPEMDAAVNRNNLIEKLCFARFGLAIKTSEGEEALKRDLNAHNHEDGRELISHQTIQKWCNGTFHPRHRDAFIFLSGYVAKAFSGEILEKLSSNQKKVLAQIEKCIRRNLEAARIDKRIYRSNQGFILNVKPSTQAFERISSQLAGIHLTFRLRLNGSTSHPVARELLLIERRESDLSFQHWHLLDSGQFTKFEGSIVPVGEILWFLAIRDKLSMPDRMRVMQFRDTGGRSIPLRWGIISTDIPQPSPEPAAARIVMLKTALTVEGLEAHKERFVKYISFDDLEELKEIMQRLLSNTVTAHSVSGTFKPEETDGRVRIDSVLRVSQSTAAAAANYLK